MTDWTSQVATGRRSRDIQALLERESVDAALAEVEQLIATSSDGSLVEAEIATRGASVDWTEIVCEAIEAHVRLRALGEGRCAAVLLELGNHADNRLRLRRYFYGPGGEPWDLLVGPSGRLGGHHGILTELMEVSALRPLAQLQVAPYVAGAEHARRVFLAGHLLVLRVLGAVQRAAAERGLPMPVTLAVRVARVGGEDAISQLGPYLGARLPCAVRPIDDDVVSRLAVRHQAHVRQWDGDTAALVRRLRDDFAINGWVSSRYVPEELVDDKARLRHLEQHLLIHDPAHRLSLGDVERLAVRIRDARDASRPRPIDADDYRSA